METPLTSKQEQDDRLPHPLDSQVLGSILKKRRSSSSADQLDWPAVIKIFEVSETSSKLLLQQRMIWNKDRRKSCCEGIKSSSLLVSFTPAKDVENTCACRGPNKGWLHDEARGHRESADGKTPILISSISKWAPRIRVQWFYPSALRAYSSQRHGRRQSDILLAGRLVRSSIPPVWPGTRGKLQIYHGDRCYCQDIKLPCRKTCWT